MNRRLPGYFLALFLPSAALIVGAAVLFYRAQAERQLELVQLRESIDTQRGANELRGFVVEYAQDVLFMGRLPSMRAALEDESAATLHALERMFIAAATAKRDVDRVRWIDETGRERVRVSFADGKAVPTRADRLQDKQDRYFVADLASRPAGTVYVSPLDLSMDEGVVERPLKPVVRVGTPLYDRDGRRRGMLLVNYAARDLLARFASASRGLYGHAMRLDGEGYWLQAPRTADEGVGPPGLADLFGNRSAISRPTMCLITRGTEAAARSSVTTLAPSRSTVIRSAIKNTSSSLWEM